MNYIINWIIICIRFRIQLCVKFFKMLTSVNFMIIYMYMYVHIYTYDHTCVIQTWLHRTHIHRWSCTFWEIISGCFEFLVEFMSQRHCPVNDTYKQGFHSCSFTLSNISSTQHIIYSHEHSWDLWILLRFHSQNQSLNSLSFHRNLKLFGYR